MEDLVKSIMTANVETIAPKELLKVALSKMAARNIGSIVVVDGLRPVGIVTERDILRCADHDLGSFEHDVESVMSQPLVIIDPDTSVDEAVRLFLKHGIRRLPVVENEMLCGIVTERDLIRWVLKAFYAPNIPNEINQILAKPLDGLEEWA
jgi:CBS domain-containing protein